MSKFIMRFHVQGKCLGLGLVVCKGVLLGKGYDYV